MFCYVCVGIARTRDPAALNRAVAGPDYPITDDDGTLIAFHSADKELRDLGIRPALTAVGGTPVCAEHLDHIQAPFSAYGAAQMQLAQMQPVFNTKEG